jgi:hypothetical protein
VHLVEANLKRCVQPLPKPRDGIWLQGEPVINSDIRRCGQEFLAFWQKYGESEAAAFNHAAVLVFPAVGCTYTDLMDADVDTKLRAERPISCSQ